MYRSAENDSSLDELLLWSALAQLSRVASSARSIEQLYDALTFSIGRFFSFDRLTIRLVDTELDTVTDAYVWGAEIPGWSSGEIHDLDGTATAEIVENGQTVVIDDVRLRADHALRGSAADLPALLGVPLVSRGNTMGTLQVRSKTAGAFTDDDVHVAESFATHIAPVIENAIHIESLNAEAQERQVLLRLAQTITSSLDIDSVFEQFAELMAKVIPSDRVVINTLNPDGLTYTERFSNGVRVAERMPGNVVHMEGTLTKEAIDQGGPIKVDVDGEAQRQQALARLPGLKPALDSGLCAFLTAPMISEGRVIGTIHARNRKPYSYSSKHESMIGQIAVFVASAIGKADLLQQIESESQARHVLAEIGRVIGSTLDFGDVFDQVAQLVRKLVPADRIVVTTVDEELETISDRYIWGHQIPVWDLARNKPLPGLPTESVVRGRKTLVFTSAVESGVNDAGIRAGERVGLQSAMYAPLVYGDRVIGTLNVKSLRQNAYTESDTEVLKEVALQIAGAIAASDLYLETLRLANEREKRLQAESENNELLRVNQAKSEFLSTVSHELKTPLTSILAFTGVLRRNETGNMSDRDVKQLEVIKRNGERLSRLISDLVDVSRIDAATINLTPSRFDLRETMSQLLESFEPVVAAKQQTLTVTSPDGKIPLHADSDRITQVISNLISNASKYSPPSSEIQVAVKTNLDPNVVSISVTDRGIGISEQDRKRLFTAFFRADNEITRSQPGTGLGLVIARSIAEMHGGSLTVESEPDNGSTFTLAVPQEFRGGSSELSRAS